jgi:hypothetical protein
LPKIITIFGNFIKNKNNFIATEKSRQAMGDTEPPKPRLAMAELAEEAKRVRNHRVEG